MRPIEERNMDKVVHFEMGAINGGLFQRPKEAPNPAIYVGVASVESAIAKVTKAGLFEGQ
jgi:predicted enzyme related to lactoylglutathione lyase